MSTHSGSDDEDVKFVAPAPKDLNAILETDKDDPSLQKYKQQLLGGSATNAIIDASNPDRVIVKKISLLADQGEVCSQELPPPSQFTLRVKEGERYRLQFEFYVQREIVCGLKYYHKVTRSMLKVAKETYMIGSYPPSEQLVKFVTPFEHAPSGMIARGKYNVQSKIVDDDNNVYSEFAWILEIGATW